jgi:hypothetical protein
MTPQTRWMIKHPLRYLYLRYKYWIPRLSAYWRPHVGVDSFNLSAPAVQLSMARWHLLVIPWEWFVTQDEFGHYWGFVLLNINGRALLSITHDGARGLFL